MEKIKNLLENLNFILKSGENSIWQKEYFNYLIQINLDEKDINKSTINWGGKIQVGSSTTSNFSQNETLVVLECVDRLLTKGYKPEDIYLEKVYPSGHGTSGRLDILVQKEGKAFLMIECKTWGGEYEKELKNTHKDGGQLLKYLQQDKSAEYLVLYTSKFENDKIDYKNEIIVVEQSYRETSNVKDLFDRWNKFTKSTGIFDSWVKPYNFESKALTTNQLKPITQGDSGFIFNRFLEILRHNAVSDKPNAFNRIFTLFLCKVKDEDRQPDEGLDFQWIEGEDDHISFQVRLSDLYKSAMSEFLDKEITDLSSDDFDKKYNYIDESTRTKLKNELIKLRLQKNNEFAIKDVFDQETFEENAVVLKEVVELLQPFKFRYNKKQPFLGEFFELLLTTGLKQEAGQFFTPVPIARFICRSLPMREAVNKKLQYGVTNELLPNIIDYACGSGHFLTEGMEEIHNIIKNIDSSKFTPKTARSIESWKINQFDWAFEHVYGIERDYRLVKTTKVGCYLHGDGIARIIHGDGLDAFDSKNYQGKLRLDNHKTENPRFDFILSNPPYSVSSFKGNLKNKYASNPDTPEAEKPFELYKSLTDQSSEIEVLFIERTKQLLVDGGIAAIILPSSIFSNTGLYTKSREILLKYFEFISIVELGNNTFMATGTNTVILFLKRRNNYEWQTIQSHIQKAFETKQDLTINGVEKLISKYLKNTEQKIELEKYLKEFEDDDLEKEKLLYFALAYPQKIALIKSGEKDEEKKFLGYYFSNRRGHEGIKPFVAGGSVDDCTYLYDEKDLFNPKKASTYIQKAFAGELANTEIDEELKEHVFKVDLVDLIDFESKKFEKIINTRAKKKLKIESQWEVVKLGEVCDEIINGGTPSKSNPEYWNSNDVKWLTTPDFKDGKLFLSETSQFVSKKAVAENKTKIVPKNSVLLTCTATIGKICINTEELTTNQQINGIVCNSKILPEYLANYLKEKKEDLENLTNNSGVKHINLTMLRNFPLVLPPLKIQTQIVNEIEKIENEGQKAKTEIENLKTEISELVENAGGEEVRLGEVSEELFAGGDKPNNFSKVKNNELQIPIYANSVENKGLIGYSNIFRVEKPCVTISARGSIGFCVARDEKFFPIVRLIVLIPDLQKSLPIYLEYKLNSIKIEQSGTNIPQLTVPMVREIKIPLPPLAIQQKIVAEIMKIEEKIKSLQQVVDALPKQKEAVLKKYL